jgi:hypothetical protein
LALRSGFRRSLMFGMAGSPEASSARIVSCGRGLVSTMVFTLSIDLRRKYLAAIRGEDLVGQFDGVIVLVRGPGHHGVAVVGEKSEYFVQSAEDWWMGKDL